LLTLKLTAIGNVDGADCILTMLRLAEGKPAEAGFAAWLEQQVAR